MPLVQKTLYLLLLLQLAGQQRVSHANPQAQLGPPIPERIQNAKPIPLCERIRPLGDLIAKGEGTWDSVNRGNAGDTPGGIKRITGKSFSQMTIGEVISRQRRQIYAVGRYQLIPSTLAFAVKRSGTNYSETFSPKVQDRLLLALLEHKRPAVASFLEGKHDNLAYALDELSREWASIGWRNGRSYYSGYGRNYASVTRNEAKLVLLEIREYDA